MKKVSLILLLVIFASVALMAATPLKLIRVTFINKSAHTVYLKLEGQTQDQFYYLTIPKGDKTIPEEVTFTIMADVYDRTMWYGPGDLGCEGVTNSGELWLVQQSKFVFLPCGQAVPNKWDYWYYDDVTGITWYIQHKNMGEPVWGEKVVYYKYLKTEAKGNAGSCWWNVESKTYKSPTGNCAFLWQY